MQYVSMAIVGLIVGIISRFLYPGQVPMGLVVSMLLGIAGSFLAGFIGNMIHKKPDGPAFSRAGFIYSIIGSMLLIFLLRNVFHVV
jgi:uncharacterized membrane protein YeaQ/YmgE (transglycosylase-associated protein family)